MPDRAMAEQLARALDGEDTGVEEVERLASLLRGAAGVARFEVTAGEIEQSMARIPRPARRRRRSPRRSLVAVAAAAAIAVAAIFALPESHAPGFDVEARALAALARGGPILHSVTSLRSPNGGDVVTRIDWLDPATGVHHVLTQVGARVVFDTLRKQDGGVVQYQGSADRIVIAPSCRAIAGACADLADPISFYQRALARAQHGAIDRVTFQGRPAYRFALPVQALGGATNPVEQIVTLDAATYLPRRIVWRERPAGAGPRVTAVIDVGAVDHLGRADASQALALNLPAGVPVVQLDATGRDLGTPSIRELTLAQARAGFPDGRWLGPSFEAHPLSGVRELRWPSGDLALRIDYGPLTLWSFDVAIPPALLEGVVVPEKLVSQGGVVERFYSTSGGRLAAERDLASGSVAAVGPNLGKLDLFAAVLQARPL